MRESIGNALLFNIVLVIIGAIILLLVASFSYSKAFKAKNKIINVMEKYDGFTEDAMNEVNADLQAMGYQLNNSYNNCKERENGNLLYGNVMGNYHYCVYEFSTSKGMYYGVTTYMHFNIPLVGGNIAVPVYGESRIIYHGIEG